MNKNEALQELELKPGYTENDLKQAYRQLVRKYHPDVTGGKTADRFIRIGEAYKLLSSYVNESGCKLTHISIFKFRKA